MKISTEIGSIAKITGEERAVEYVARAGFDAWDFSMFQMCLYDWENRKAKKTNHPLAGADYAAFAKRLRKVGEDNGIVCNQAHAPFPTVCGEIRSYFKRAIECTAIAGGKICVIHPENDKSAEENAEIFSELLPFAKECGVKIATENMWNWDDEKGEALFAACATPESFNEHLDAVNDSFFVACLDIGHAEMNGLKTSAPEMIHALGTRLAALHIHDNDKVHDLHQIPFSGQIDFAAAAKALRDIGYDGYLTLEADTYMESSGFDAETAFKGVCNLAAAAKRIDAMF